MQSLAKCSTADLRALSKFAQVYTLIFSDLSGSAMKQANRIIRKEGDVNFQIPANDQAVMGSTLLHIAAEHDSSELMEDLLNLGVNFTLKDENGETALHLALRRSCYRMEKNEKTSMILSAHVKFGNFANPCDNSGFSHFHIACIENHVEAVRFFLENRVDVNQAVNKERSAYPGFTPLHCAVKSYSIETVEILLKHGADEKMINGFKMTPLHQLIKRRIQLMESTIRDAAVEESKSKEVEFEKIDQIMFILLGNNFLDHVNIVDSSGLSSLHIACMMQDLCRVESLLEHVQNIDHCISPDSPMWPGYSALHFAAHCNIDAMKILHSRGANFDLKNAKGLTPFDICFRIDNMEKLHAAISLKPELANILFSDNTTRLVNFVSAMRDTTQLSNFLHNCVTDVNMTLPNDSPLWPGCTPLHFAVIVCQNFYSYYASIREPIFVQIQEMLNNGANITLKDASGKTPLHHAFRENKEGVCELLRRHHGSSANPVDSDNLSHLHIASVQHDEKLVERLLSNSSTDINIPYKGEKDLQRVKPGWTPLNCADSYCYKNVRKILLERGATEFTIKEDQRDVNTLHYACEKRDKDAVLRLLELGADIDLVLDDRTPLYIAAYYNSLEIVELLLQRGADLIGKNHNRYVPLYCIIRSIKDVSQFRNVIMSTLKQDIELQKRVEVETGITMLHIACYFLDVEEVRRQLDRGVDVDVQVHKDSELWSEHTALLVLMCKVKEGLSKEEIPSDVAVITELLLEKGADVMEIIDEFWECTPVHISHDCLDADRVSRTRRLLNYLRDFEADPVDNSGVSLFHIAVMMNSVEAVEKFLENGVNVDRPIDYFAETNGGLTPLHMAINNANTKDGGRIVDLLLERGADVNLEDASGNSALHKAIESLESGSLRLNVIEKLLSHGANINSEDIYGITPFEYLLLHGNPSAEDIRFFVKRGCRVNASNPADDRSYIGVILSKKDKELRDSLFGEVMKAPDFGIVNELRRTLMHSVVAVTEPAISSQDYLELLESFNNEFGFDVDDQDHAGQTALHLAAIFGNDKAIWALLNMGADMQIFDAKGKTALSYAIELCTKCENDTTDEHYHEKAVEILVVQVLKLRSSVGAHWFNCKMIDEAFKILNWNGNLEDDEEALDPPGDFYGEMCQADELELKHSSLQLWEFLRWYDGSEKSAVTKYSLMSEASRRIIDRAIDSIDLYFEELVPIFKLQHRKAMLRFQLLHVAPSFNLLIRFPLPELCTRKILRYLRTPDLRRLVGAMKLVMNEN